MQEDPFGILKPDDFNDLGIDPSDIPQGTLAGDKHPPLLSSRFGGNAYGFGFFEIYDHLNPDDVKFIQSVNFDNPDKIKKHYKRINQIYKRIGLLIRFSSFGKPYYLIPTHLVSTSVANIRNKSDEISKIIDFHRKKYLKESHRIGILTNSKDPVLNDLTIRFREHQFIIIDSPERLRSIDEILDLIIIPRDIYRTIILEMIGSDPKEALSLKQLEKRAIYMLGKIYRLLKPEGELYVIANKQPLKTNRMAAIRFETIQEKKNFFIFTHIFKTRKRYKIKEGYIQINVFDFERYLSVPYVEQAIIKGLIGNRDLKSLTLNEIDDLSYLDIPLDNEFAYNQQKTWPKLFSIYFNEIFHKTIVPASVESEWKSKYSIKDHTVDYFLIYLAQKKSIDINITQLKSDIAESKLAGCPLPLLASYRNSFEYVIRTLDVLNKIKEDSYTALPEIFMERLREPIDNKKRRYSGINDILKLMAKTQTLEKIQSYLNPDRIRRPNAKVLENLEILPFYGFSYGELKEMFLIVVGHSAMGRILSGKMNEKALNPVSDLARRHSGREALNLLRYCRLMSMAETVASKRTDMNQEQLEELFDLFDSMVRIVTNRDLDWDRLLDEKISGMGGIHNKLIRKLLMMMNNFEFLNNWSELPSKGEMEKESLANYDDQKLDQIENIIDLIRIIELFENKFFSDDPLQLPVIYRKILDMEFHGTGHIFERMKSQLAFTLLWITVNVNRGEIINFNPILPDIRYADIDSNVRKIEEEARLINRDYLDPQTLNQFSSQLHENSMAFIINTGFKLTINRETKAIDISFTDIDNSIRQLEVLAKEYSGCRISEIPVEDLKEMERLFADLEGFYNGHIAFVSGSKGILNLPKRQKIWFEKVLNLRQYLESNLLNDILEQENVFSDLDMLYHNARTILYFAFPEFASLQNVSLTGKIYLKSPLFTHVLNSTKKIQALIKGEMREFQDQKALHRLAQREFGPLAAGIVGFNDSQIEMLRSIILNLKGNTSLFNAFIKSFIFQDLGLSPDLREKYKGEFNNSDQAQAGAFFLMKENIPKKYNMDKASEEILIYLVGHHDWIHHIIRGEFSLHSIKEITDKGDKELLNAFFVSSLIMFSALREDLILEDLAAYLFKIKSICEKIIGGETSFEEYFRNLHIKNGHLHYALEEFHEKGIPHNMPPAQYMSSWTNHGISPEEYIKAGMKIYSIERIFRLKGIRYVDFSDLACLISKVPLRYIFQKKNYFGIGYATFEKELFEALRIYNCIRRLPETIRKFILNRLSADQVRIFGFENVSIFLNYENQIKLLYIALLGSKKFRKNKKPISLNFLPMVNKVDKRYEIINDFLNNISVEKTWSNRYQINHFFKAKTGISFDKDEQHRVLEIDFFDKVNISRKLSHMDTIADVDQLKNYYHYSLQSLRKSPFYTDDYESLLEESFYKRLEEITDIILEQAKKQMELLNDFKDLHHLYTDLIERSLEIGFSEDQNHRLNDLYELRKDNLKREKLEEINSLLEKIHDVNELRDYWDGIKWYLSNNRQYIGKEFETLIANNFDMALKRIKDMSFQVHFMS